MGQEFFETQQILAQKSETIGALTWVIGGFFLFAMAAAAIVIYFKYLDRQDSRDAKEELKVRKDEIREHESKVQETLGNIRDGVTNADAKRQILEGRVIRLEKDQSSFGDDLRDFIKSMTDEFKPAFHKYKVESESEIKSIKTQIVRIEVDLEDIRNKYE